VFFSFKSVNKTKKQKYVMNIQTKITILGVFAGVAIVAFASSGACNHIETNDCKAIDSPCSAKIDGCTLSYDGVVKKPSKRNKRIASGPGYSSFDTTTNCTYVCSIKKDCDGDPVEVDCTGGPNFVKSANAESCP
jgi:hypothetical protein